MITSEDIHKLPLHEKLRIMETLWEDITRRESDLEMPQWQKDMLDERESMVASGDANPGLQKDCQFVGGAKAHGRICSSSRLSTHGFSKFQR